MRSIAKLLLSACAVCAVAQGRAAFAQSDPQANPMTDPAPLPRPGDPPTSTPLPTPDPSTSPTPSTPPPPVPNSTPTDQTPAPPPPAPTDTTTAPAPAPTTGSPSYGMAEAPDSLGYAWYDDRLQSGIGISTLLGGGVAGFTDSRMRATTADLGGLWDLRVTLGSHIPLALDVSYLGSATSLNGLPTGQKGTLIGTTVEAALRYNILPHAPVDPYVFAGAGWQRYDVTQAAVSLADSGINNHGNLLEFPVGAGVAYRIGGFVADLRGTFRAAVDPNLVLVTPMPVGVTPTSNDFAPMHTWEASAAVGYEF